MKKFVRNTLIVASSMLAIQTMAQQTPQSSVYNYNRFALNPAYAGAEGCTQIFFSHLNQWGKVEGAPVTSLLSVNSRLGKNWGVGGSMLIDKVGMLQQIAASGSVSYGIRLGAHNIRLGLTAGYYQFRVNPTSAVVFDLADNIVNGGSQSSSSINTEVGLMYRFKGLDLGVSSKQVIQTFSNFGYTNLDGYGLKRHIIALAGYKFQINQNLALRPSVMYKGIPQISQFDFNADVMYKDFIQGGLGYRTGVGLIGRVGINIQDLFFIGYAYEAPMRNIAKYSSGSHEVIIGLKLCRNKKSVVVEDILADVPKSDTIVRIEYKIDTLVVERVDTVFMDSPQNRMVSNQEAERVLDLAAKTLEFENDKAIILKKSHGDLESLTNIMLMRTDLKIRLEGHTDNNGTEEYNMELSKNRVQAVKDFLVANGVDPSRIELQWFGESKPISENNTEEGKARNRRVLMEYLGVEK